MEHPTKIGDELTETNVTEWLINHFTGQRSAFYVQNTRYGTKTKMMNHFQCERDDLRKYNNLIYAAIEAWEDDKSTAEEIRNAMKQAETTP